MKGAVKILLADDHALVRAGIRSMLEGLLEVEVIGEANDGREALQMVASLSPDLVFMDIAMPGLNGLDTAARITRDHPDVRVVILSMYLNEEYVLGALRAGATGYLLKDADPSELELAVRAVTRWGKVPQPRGIKACDRGLSPPDGDRSAGRPGYQTCEPADHPPAGGAPADCRRAYLTRNRPNSGHQPENCRISPAEYYGKAGPPRPCQPGAVRSADWPGACGMNPLIGLFWGS